MEKSSDFFKEKEKNAQYGRLARKKRIGVVAIVWFFIGLYFITPLSKVGTPKVKDLVYLNRNQIVQVSHLKSQSFIWDVESKKVESLINNSNSDFILSSKVSKGLNGITISINELFPVAQVNTSSYLFTNRKGETISRVIDLSYYSQDSYSHLTSSPFGNPLENLPRLINDSGINDFKVIARALGESDVELINYYLSEITLTPVNEKYKAELLIFDSAIVNNYDHHIRIVFDNPEKISVFLTKGYYRNAVSHFNNFPNVENFHFFNGKVTQ